MKWKLLNKDGEVENAIVASEAFVKSYCENHGYTFDEIPEPSVPVPAPNPVPDEPSQLDRVEAQAVYTAMMTDTLLEE